MSTGKNKRRHRRVSYLSPIRISWEDRGQQRYALGKCVDISQAGLRLETPQPIAPGTLIQVAADQVKLSGSATVKHTVRIGSKYLLGAELTQFMLDSTVADLAGRPAVTVLIENLNRID